MEERISEIVADYKKFKSELLQAFSEVSGKCRHNHAYRCWHPEAIKRRNKDYDVDSRCKLNDCPI